MREPGSDAVDSVLKVQDRDFCVLSALKSRLVYTSNYGKQVNNTSPAIYKVVRPNYVEVHNIIYL